METKLLSIAVLQLSTQHDKMLAEIEELKNEIKNLKAHHPVDQTTPNPTIVVEDKSILLDTKEVMEILGICYNSLDKLVKKGEIKRININQRRVRFPRESVNEYIQNQLKM
jgi:excisionase family DNA binding protein